MQLGNILNAALFEIQNPVFHKLASDPSTPIIGQYYFNTTINRLKYWSGSSGTGAGWVIVDPASAQVVNLTGEITGSLSAGNIPTIANKVLITNKLLVTDFSNANKFLVYDSVADRLASLRFDDLQTWIEGIVPTGYSLNADTSLGDTRIILSNTLTNSSVRIGGTANEVEVALDGTTPNRIIVGLPNNVVIPTLSVTNLTINGTPYAPYTHPFYATNNLVGSGIQFIQSLQTDAIGSVYSATLGTIPSASTTVIGVVRFATNAEITAGTAGVAVQASQLGSLLGSWGYSTTLTGTNVGGNFTVTHNLGTRAVIVELYDASTFETVTATVVRTSTNVVTVTTGAGAPANIVALVRRVV